MRIGFDVSQTAEAMAGCGIFQDAMCRHLVEVAPEHTFMPYPVFNGYRNPAFKQATRPDAPNVLALHHHRSWHALNAGWDAKGSLYEFLGRPDVVHSNSFGCPRHLGAPLVYTVYDLSPIDHPEYHTEENRLVCFNGLYEASLYADALIAISAFTRERFLHWFPHVDPGRVTVVHPAARPSLCGPASEAADVRTLRKFELEPDGFWLAVGTIEPRKNYPLLLEAYARVRDAHPGIPALCIAGQAGWKESSLESRIRALGLADRVKCLGFVPDEDLAALYRRCLGFVFPSHYEGFGLPVIEALACGAAVIASRVASVPEVVGDAGLLIDPGSVDDLARAMTGVLTDAACRDRLRAAARIQAARFSWRDAAVRVRDVYESLRAGVTGGSPAMESARS
jgi:glycosyltransferase involved in cell wall biosynthesis